MKKLFLFCIVFCFLGIANADALNAAQSHDSAEKIYSKKLITVTKSLFYKLKLDMTYDQAVKVIGKPPLFCTDQKTRYCNSDATGKINEVCLNLSFIQRKTQWSCHWDGQWTGKAGMSAVNLSFSTNQLTYIMLETPDGTIYARKSDGSVFIDKSS